ncbi:MAG: biotin--[acetyl-CoA-carboxylase] ligase [Christensenellales bacterium]
MDALRIRQLLRQPLPLRCLALVDSTNLAARAWAEEGAEQGATLLADAQSAGRGRLGRSFFSPGGGLYMSSILYPGDLAPGLLTTLAAVCVLRAVKQTLGIDLKIKWVNDLLLEGRKVCGILAEGLRPQGKPPLVILGIGINTGLTGFPQDLQGQAGTLAREGRVIDREALAAAILNELMAGLPVMPAHLPDYRAHCLTLGQTVRFTQGRETGLGLALDVDEGGALLIRTEGGILRLIAGEASLRQPDGSYV